jgi:putative acetyltransferase
VIRPYEAADREPAASLWVAAWQLTMPEIDFAARRGWILDRLDTQTATGTVTICAESGGALTGFAMVEPAPAHLEQLVIAPDRFGSGIGTRLLEAAKRRCPERLSLRVNQDNPRAVRFYRREGFRIVGEGVNPGGRLKTWDMTWLPYP